MAPYDPKKVSSKSMGMEWLTSGGWMVMLRADGESKWVHLWPDNQQPEGIFTDKAEAEAFALGARERANQQGATGETIIVQIAPIQSMRIEGDLVIKPWKGV